MEKKTFILLDLKFFPWVPPVENQSFSCSKTLVSPSLAQICRVCFKLVPSQTFGEDTFFTGSLRFVVIFKMSASTSSSFALRRSLVALCHNLQLGCDTSVFRSNTSDFGMASFNRWSLPSSFDHCSLGQVVVYHQRQTHIYRIWS